MSCECNEIQFFTDEFIPMVTQAVDEYTGMNTVKPNLAAQVLPTAGKYLEDDITVNPIELTEIENDYGIGAVIGGI